MATQSNNLILLELDPLTGLMGMQRTLATSDALALNVNAFNATTQGAYLVSGGSTADVQAPYVSIGTESAGGETNVEVDIGQPASIVKIDGAIVYFDAPIALRASEAGIKIEAGEALSAGDVVTIDGSQNPASALVPRMVQAEADAVDEEERAFAGVVISASIASGANGYAASIAGSVVAVSFKATDAPAAGSEGSPVYVSTDIGKAQMTAPSLSGQTVYQIGLLTSSTAVSGSKYAVLLAPQLIGRIP